MDKETAANKNTSLLKELLADFRRFIRSVISGEFFRTLKRDFTELKEFYLEEERLKKALLALAKLSAREIGRSLLEEIETFIGKARVHDDLSLIIIKRKEQTA